MEAYLGDGMRVFDIWPNDFGPNDFGPNGFRPNDFRPNDFRPNDFGPNDGVSTKFTSRLLISPPLQVYRANTINNFTPQLEAKA
jgi:hypothetical protein